MASCTGIILNVLRRNLFKLCMHRNSVVAAHAIIGLCLQLLMCCRLSNLNGYFQSHLYTKKINKLLLQLLFLSLLFINMYLYNCTVSDVRAAHCVQPFRMADRISLWTSCNGRRIRTGVHGMANVAASESYIIVLHVANYQSFDRIIFVFFSFVSSGRRRTWVPVYC